MQQLLANLKRDPRYYQILVLGLLTSYGLWQFDFGPSVLQCSIILASALGFQFLFTKLYNLPAFDPRSPLISGLSLCLLLRTNLWWLAVLAALLAIGSKFVLRTDQRHIFNPTNFGIALVVLFTDHAWVSPGQWGSGVLLAFLFACAGMMVLYRAARSDVTLVFLGCWAAVVFGRAVYLSDPWSIPQRQVQSGALLLFAFFMISDPKTTPDSRRGRAVFALLVALIAGALQLNWATWSAIPLVAGLEIPVNWVDLRANGMMYALVISCCFTPLINKWLPGPKYQWVKSGNTGKAATNQMSAIHHPHQEKAAV